MAEVTVVGGGPAGSLTASLLARGHDVTVLEEHRAPGEPVQCAGLVTDEVIRMSGVSPDVHNTLYGAQVVFPGGSSVEVRSGWPKARVIDRADLDSKMADAAMSAGADYVFGERYLGHRSGEYASIRTSSGERRADVVVGADGWRSAVAAQLGGNGPRETVRGIQADVSVRMEDQDLFRINLGSRYAPGFFTWEIPCGDFTRVGLCTSWSAGPPYGYLRRLLSDTGADGRIIKMYSGAIPLGGRRVTYGDRCLLVGDAAGQVKPVSGGGLYPAFRAAPLLCGTVDRAASTGDFSSAALSRYERMWRDDFGKELRDGYRLRRLLLRMDDADLDRAGRYASRPEVVSVLNGIDLDHPSSVARGILKHPMSVLRALPVLAGCLL